MAYRRSTGAWKVSSNNSTDRSWPGRTTLGFGCANGRTVTRADLLCQVGEFANARRLLRQIQKRKERKKGVLLMPLLISVHYITKYLNCTVSHQNRNRNKDKHCDLNSHLNKYSASRHQAPASVDTVTQFFHSTLVFKVHTHMAYDYKHKQTYVIHQFNIKNMKECRYTMCLYI